MTSGLDLARPPRSNDGPKPGAVIDGPRAGRREPSRRLKPERPERPEIDPSTHGAAMIIALGYLLFAVVVVVRERAGLEMVIAAAIASVVTYVVYWLTGWFARNLGVIGLIFLGGWFQFLVGMLAQLIYQLMPIRWWVVGVAYLVVGVIAALR